MRVSRAAALTLAAALCLPAAMAEGPSGAHQSGASSHSSASHSKSSTTPKSSGKSRHSSSKPSSHPGTTSNSGGFHPPNAVGVHRNAHGKIERSDKARNDFKRLHPCPSTGKSSGSCPGYVIDHVVPLKRGGTDAPPNMQWQTEADAKAKDRWE